MSFIHVFTDVMERNALVALKGSLHKIWFVRLVIKYFISIVSPVPFVEDNCPLGKSSMCLMTTNSSAKMTTFKLSKVNK